MPKTRPIFCNFNKGELDPLLEGRVDIEGYFNSVHLLENLICKSTGSLVNRGGWHYVGMSKNYNSGDPPILIPFIYAELQNYVICAEDLLMRFYMNSGQIMNPEKVTNGSFATDTGWTKGANWTISTGKARKSAGAANNLSQDTAEVATEIYKVVYTIDSISGGSLTVSIGGTSGTARSTTGTFTEYITATNTNNLTFTPSVAGVACVIDDVMVKKVNADYDEEYEITSPYSEDELPDLWWAQGDINLYIIHPDHIPYILTRTDHDEWTITAIDFTGGPFMDEDTTITITPSGTTGDIEMDASSDLWEDDHVGALWQIRHTTTRGVVKITAVDSATHAHATVQITLGGVGASDGQSEGCWSDVNGYPRAICFDEGRLLFASTYEQPNTIWASKTRNFTTFTYGTDDDDAYSFTVSEVNIIRWIQKARFLSMGCLDGEATAESSDILTPTNPPLIKSQTPHGSSEVKPVHVGKAIIFIQKASKKLREFVYDYANDAYNAPDLNIMASHIAGTGFTKMIYAQEPYSVIYCINGDSDLVGCTYDRSVNAIGWHNHPTDGTVQDICTIPYANKDQVWGVIKRTINLEDRYYIEYLDDDICVDSGLTYSGSAVTSFSGLDHLVGKTVWIVGDDANYGQQTVPASGTISITGSGVSTAYIGLNFTPKLQTNRPEANVGGTIQGLQQGWNRVFVRVYETQGLKINDQIVPARTTEDLMDEAPSAYTGDIAVENLGWDDEGRIEVEQTLPLPCNILAIFGELNIGTE